MAISDIFSKRQKRLRGDVVDVFQYDEIPDRMRVQTVQICHEIIGNSSSDYRVEEAYRILVEALRREYGVFRLPPSTRYDGFEDEFCNFLLSTGSTEECLDAIELAFRFIDRIVRKDDHPLHGYGRGAELADGAIDELNVRFKENGVGYQFVEDGEIVRVDSQLLHTEAVKPALTLLNTREYQGPHEEFINAYDHYKHGKNKEALNDCLKAFESTMKAICDKRGWAYDPKTTTAKPLIDIMFTNGLVPSFWQTQLGSLRSLLESSVPTGRNKLAGHGQGSTPIEVPDEITAYMLHMTASTLVFLTTAEKALP
jgi:hypothetical protein